MTITATTRVVLDAALTVPDLQAVVEHAINNHPRSLQVELGPSELGNGCDRCLIHLLAGHTPTAQPTPWLPTIGTAVHEWLEGVVLRHLGATGTDRYIPEGRVTVGQVRGIDISGSSDLFDVHTGTVVDYKVVGKSTLDKSARHGASTTYRRQAHLYGRGWAALGYDVRSVAIWFMPRNSTSLDHGLIHQEPYDEQVAVDTLDRANRLAAFVDALGADTVLASAAPHTGAEFSCKAWDDNPSLTQTPDAFLGLG